MRSIVGSHFESFESTVPLSEVQKSAKQALLDKIKDGTYSIKTTDCPCGAVCDDVLALSDRFGLPVINVICRECGLVRIQNPLQEQSLIQFYEKEYRLLYADADSEQKISEIFSSQNRTGQEIAQLLRNVALSTLEGQHVLEVGCSCGGILQGLKDAGAIVRGYDYDKRFLEYGRTNFNLDLRYGGIDEIDDKESFDIIVLSHVLEHILDLKEFIFKALLKLKKGGFLYINVPGIFYQPYYAFYPFDFRHYLQNAHTYTFCKDTLLALLPQSCLECIYSDENVRVVSRKIGECDTSFWPTLREANRYQQVLRFVRAIERKRRGKALWYQCKKLVKLFLFLPKKKASLPVPG